jgi:tRNA (guanine37-N1)-methyltransferase
MTVDGRSGPPLAGGGPALPVDVFTIFPDAVDRFAEVSILGRARRLELMALAVHDIRDAAAGVHRSVDDAPFGGGAGMVLAPDPLFRIVEHVAASPRGLARPLFLLSPSGRRFDQTVAQELAASDGFSLLCGRYEGVDERVAEHLVDEELSVGDFVLAGGELAALAVLEAVARLLPGALGNEDSPEEESFADGLLEYPQYTRPAEFRGWAVPEVLRSGDHQAIRRWRRAQALSRTRDRRPDLLAARGGLTREEEELLREVDESDGTSLGSIIRGPDPRSSRR